MRLGHQESSVIVNGCLSILVETNGLLTSRNIILLHAMRLDRHLLGSSVTQLLGSRGYMWR